MDQCMQRNSPKVLFMSQTAKENFEDLKKKKKNSRYAV